MSRKAEKQKTKADKAEARKQKKLAREREKNRTRALKETRKRKEEKAKAAAKKQMAKDAEFRAKKKERLNAAGQLTDEQKIIRAILRLTAGVVVIVGVSVAVMAYRENSAARKALEKQAEAPEETATETVSGEEAAEEELPGEEESTAPDLQDLYPHDGGLYLIPESNDDTSVTGTLLAPWVLHRADYESFKEGDIFALNDVDYIILHISEGDFGKSFTIIRYDQNEKYDEAIRLQDFEERYASEDLIYGTTVAAEESFIKDFGTTDYFADDGYKDDDMIFFYGNALYFPVCYELERKITLNFDGQSELTVPDESMMGDVKYDVSAYLKGEHSLYPPDTMAAKVETEGRQIRKYTVMYVLLP